MFLKQLIDDFIITDRWSVKPDDLTGVPENLIWTCDGIPCWPVFPPNHPRYNEPPPFKIKHFVERGMCSCGSFINPDKLVDFHVRQAELRHEKLIQTEGYKTLKATIAERFWNSYVARFTKRKSGVE